MKVTLSTKVRITVLHFSQIMFDVVDVESSKKYFIVLQKWYNDANGGFIALPIEFVDNFIMGVTAFEASVANCGF